MTFKVCEPLTPDRYRGCDLMGLYTSRSNMDGRRIALALIDYTGSSRPYRFVRVLQMMDDLMWVHEDSYAIVA